jgi:LysM repeat protein
VAKNDTVTVFTHSRPDWSWARLNNDVYLDDASLAVVNTAPVYQPVSPEVRAAYIVKDTLKRLHQYRHAYWHPDCSTPNCYDVDILGVPSILEMYKPKPAALAASTTVTPSVALSVTSIVSASTALTVATSVSATVSISATPALSGTPRTYVVSVGDTLFLIAQRFNTTMEALVKANNLTNIDFVWTGQVLIIP